jgi:hypothetical protein
VIDIIGEIVIIGLSHNDFQEEGYGGLVLFYVTLADAVNLMKYRSNRLKMIEEMGWFMIWDVPRRNFIFLF